MSSTPLIGTEAEAAWAPRADRPRSLAARPLHALIRLYQRCTAARPSPCRYLPTCSNYALDALEGHGAARGAWLTTRRLCRCHPWGGQGWDPVPPPRKGSPRA